MAERILVVDDDSGVREALSDLREAPFSYGPDGSKLIYISD